MRTVSVPWKEKGGSISLQSKCTVAAPVFSQVPFMASIGTRIEETGTLLGDAGGFFLRRDLGGRWKLDLNRVPVDHVEKRVRITGTVVGEGLVDVSKAWPPTYWPGISPRCQNRAFPETLQPVFESSPSPDQERTADDRGSDPEFDGERSVAPLGFAVIHLRVMASSINVGKRVFRLHNDV